MSKVKLFIDTEFTSLDSPKLISIGLVDESGEHTFYAELQNGWGRRECSTFTMDEVLPHLQGDLMLRAAAKKGLLSYLAQFPDGAEILTDAPHYDGVLLQDLLKGAMPGNVTLIQVPDGDAIHEALDDIYLMQGLTRHHALHDAQAMRLAYLGRAG